MKIIDICGNGAVAINTGAKNQKFWGATVKYILTKEGFQFPIGDLHDMSTWIQSLKDKDIVVFYDVESLENTNQEASFYESRINKVRTKDARKSKKFKHEIGICSYAALKSYENSEYSRILEITSEGYLIGVGVDQDEVRGQKIKNFLVDLRQEATSESIEVTTVEVIYKDPMELVNNPVVVVAPNELIELEGIFDLDLTLLARTTTSLVVKVNTGCCTGLHLAIPSGEWVLRSVYSNSSIDITAVSWDEGVYTFTIANTPVSNQLLLSTDGVIERDDNLFEARPYRV